MKKNYEVPELLEIGSGETLILGDKVSPEGDTSGDLTKHIEGTLLDADE
jgi:hypothetical protein